jgi:kynurenine formamidase
MKIIDLSMPIEPHFRWPAELTIKGDIAAGDQFRVSKLSTPCHGFSHVDAMAHFVAGSPTIETTPLSQVVGPCRVLNLSDRPANAPIEPEHLAAADPGGAEGEILLLAAHWADRRNYREKEFWTQAPWLTRDSALWLAARKPTAVAFDFPQDFPIRLLLEGKEVPKPEHVTHDILLSHGVTLIEYVVNTSKLSAPRNLFSAAPLLIPNADGAPARFYAIEGLGV